MTPGKTVISKDSTEDPKRYIYQFGVKMHLQSKYKSDQLDQIRKSNNEKNKLQIELLCKNIYS